MKKFTLSLIAALALPLSLFAQSVEDVLPQAQSGDVKAMVELAEIYRNSWDDGSDANALKWLTKAAEAGSSEAMFKLYEVYNMGNLGVDSDEDTANAWLSKSAAKGYGEALFTQGNNCYYDDEAKGLALITKGAEAGCAEAQYFLSTYYANSWNDSYNPSTAFGWAKKAAEQNHPAAQYILATYYLKGIGTSANKAEAVKWLKKAAENEFSSAIEILEWL